MKDDQEEYERITRRIYGFDKPDMEPNWNVILIGLALVLTLGALVGFAVAFGLWGWM